MLKKNSVNAKVVQDDQTNSLVDNNLDEIIQESFYDPLETDQALAVKIENGFKSYGKFAILEGLNLNVNKGSIYGLLGPSGCGKTTILRSIVGRIFLDSGRISVFDQVPGSKKSDIPGRLVGYMPQESALYNEFNINETLFYFGLIHKMKLDDIRQRRDFLIDFLDLPPKEKSVKNLSGGQKRRVSMAIALLQEPKLLILDEPTVGVDPLLREKIWNHLVEIAQQTHTSIIITTHYIEEARKANRIGLIRNGRILAEHPPDYLLQVHNETSLENVFLKLCVKDQSKSRSRSVMPVQHEEIMMKDPIYPDQDEEISKPIKISKIKSIQNKFIRGLSKTFQLPKWNNFLSTLYKESILLRRNIGFLVFQFFIPLFQMALFCLCIGREPYDIKFGIVNNETNNSAINFLNFSIPRNASLIYINELDNVTFDMTHLNWTEAYEKTKTTQNWGFIDISENFTQDTLQKLLDFSSFSDKKYPGSNITVYLDASNQLITSLVKLKTLEAYQKFLPKFLKIYLPFIPKSILDLPVDIRPVYGNLDPEFINFMAPGIMVTVMFTLSIGLTALIFIMEKKAGLLDRSLVAGVSTIEIMLAHIVAKLLIMLVQIGFLLIISIFVFQIEIEGPVILTLILLLLQGFCGMSYGLVVSAGLEDETEVIIVTIASIFPLLLLSGILWPIEGMPNWVRVITNISPLTQAAEAMRCIASRGWDLTYYSVWLGWVLTLVWSFVFDIIALFLFNSSKIRMSGTQIITQPRPILKKSPARTIKKPVFFTPSLSIDSDDSECDLMTQYNDSKKTENTIESNELNDKFIELDRFQISRLGSKKSPIKSNKRKSLSPLYIFHSTEINKEIIKKLLTSTDNFLDEFKQNILKTTNYSDKDLLNTHAGEFLPKLKDFITGDENNMERLYDRMHMFEVGATLSDPTFYELEKYRKENQLKLKQTSSTGKIDKKTLEKSLGIFAIENKQDDEIIAGSLPARSFFDSYDKELKNKEKILLKTMRSKSIKTSNEENLLFSQAAANKSVKDKNKCIVSTATSTKKMVRFADAFGLDLENVKIITNNSFVDAFSYAQNETTTKEVKNKTFSLNEDDTLKCVSKPFLVLIPLFALKKPTLDSIIKLDDFIFDYENKLIKCVIRVKNLSYNKHIFARITFNNWKKYNDLDAIYVKSESSSINKTHSTSLHSNDYFAFCIIIPEKNHVTTTPTNTTTTELKHSAIEECTLRIEFALCYEENGNTYWDNNSGENYKFQCFYNIN